MDTLTRAVHDTRAWMKSPRFEEITRLHSARQVVEQQGTMPCEYPIAARYSAEFYELLRELYAAGESVTTFGPYSPGQAAMMKRMGIRAIYLGGWATSAKGSITEDPGPDLASYPLSQVPDEAAVIVRALITADKNQQFARSRMTKEQREATPEHDFRPFIIADADTGHGGDAHVRNLIRRFVEVGVTGYHIEDQKPGAKKCGHQGGKVLVAVDEQIKRLNAARFQLDVMKVPGIIVARTDAEAANLLETDNDERDHPFILGATNPRVPSYRHCFLAILKRFHDRGVEDVNGHLLYYLPAPSSEAAEAWLAETKLSELIDEAAGKLQQHDDPGLDKALDQVVTKFVAAWEKDAGIATFGEAVADQMRLRKEEGEQLELTPDQWRQYVAGVSLDEARDKAESMGLDVFWSAELARTPEGYYQVRGGIDYAIAKSLAVSPYCDLLWMETKTADLEDAKRFADAIHAVYPEKMLAYNLSPSFNWDTTGMNDEQMREFPRELGRMGFVFNFITYGGHQIDGLAAEEFATGLRENGMLALAQLQRKFRLLDSPYRTPQTLAGGNRIDAALTASSGRTATTKAMGAGSTQFQHLVQTEVPLKLLDGWLQHWARHNELPADIRAKLRPHVAASDVLELSLVNGKNELLANVVFAAIKDRRKRSILSIRDQNTLATALRRKRLMLLAQLYLIHRYKAESVHYVTPTEDNMKQATAMQTMGVFDDVNTEVGDMIVSTVNGGFIKELVENGDDRIEAVIAGR